MAGIPTILIGNLINNIKIDKELQLKTELLSQNNLSTEQTEQINYLISQNALNTQMNGNYFNYINQFLIKYDNIWSNIDLCK